MSALHDHDAERMLLGLLSDTSMLDLERARGLVAEAGLTPEHFHAPLHAETWRVALELIRDGHPVDFATVASRHRTAGLDAIAPLLISAPLSESSWRAHVTTVRECALRRKAVAAADAVREAALNPLTPVEDVLTIGSEKLSGLTQATYALRDGSTYVLDLIDALEAAQEGRRVACIPSGIDVWDHLMGGWQCGHATFIGSQPGVGKSALLGTAIHNLCRAEVPSLLFSLEDQGSWLAERWVAWESGIPLNVLAHKPLTVRQQEDAGTAAERVHRIHRHVLIDDRSMLTAAQVVQTAREAIYTKGVRVVFLDHLGKLDHEAKKHGHAFDLAIEHTLQMLTALAKETGVALVIAAHLKGRDAGAKFTQPTLTDFARTAFIERDARVAVGLYADERNPKVLHGQVLKQTKGVADRGFSLLRLSGCGLVSSRNGELKNDDDGDAQTDMNRQRDALEAA